MTTTIGAIRIIMGGIIIIQGIIITIIFHDITTRNTNTTCHSIHIDHITHPIDHQTHLIMAGGNRALYDALAKDRLYTKSYEEFQKQFSDPEKIKRLYTVMNADKVYTKPVDTFMLSFFEPSNVPSYKYQSTRDYTTPNSTSLAENTALEKKFKEKHGDKNLWTRYAYINSDEQLKDLLTTNENQVDPYTLAGVISSEGLIDELVFAKSEDPNVNVNDYYKGESISSAQTFGLDDFMRRHSELEQKGLTKLKLNMGEQDQASLDSSFLPSFDFYNEKGEVTKPVRFMTPKAGINAVSSYVKNIENMVDSSGVKMTPEEKEFLVHVGYNFGEGGLRTYLKKSKTGKEVINKIKSERPQVYNNVRKRVIISQELRENASLEPSQK
jgi:hypothetical protein